MELMTNTRRKLLAMAMAGVVSAGVFAQKHGDDKRPPKPPNTVVVAPKGERPPKNDNSKGDKGKGDKRGRP